MRVRYCRESTIEEAWAGVMGVPAVADPTEAAALLRAARKHLKDLELRPSLVTVDATRLSGPYWTQKVAWNDGRNLACFGHRYLTVHFLRNGGARYETYEASLLPHLKTWLHIVADAFGGDATDQLVSDVSYGYVNRFEFPARDFDISHYFKLGLTLGNPRGHELFGFETTFQLRDRTDLVITNNVSASLLKDGMVNVQTKFVAGKVMTQEATFGDEATLTAAIGEAKEGAKSAFFDFATAKTHDLMGVETDAAEQPDRSAD